MRIIVVSDTHQNFRALHDLVQRQRERTDLFLHLGDGEREVETLLALEPQLPLQRVRGNCDFDTAVPLSRLVHAQQVRILMVHGHEHRVKYSLEPLIKEARAVRASVALFGHTHCPYYAYEDGLHLMNPGSLSQPRNSNRGYGVIEIRDNQILCNLVAL